MSSGFRLREGWYLMSTRDLEIELALERDTGADVRLSNAQPITVREALAFRNAGNIPDELDRTLRLVLRLARPGDVYELQSRRLAYEPDYLEAPSWRGPDSRPINVVPLQSGNARHDPTRNGAGQQRPESGSHPDGGRQVATEERVPWWEQPDLAHLDAEWRATGRVAGVAVPGPYRGFVYKTVVELEAAGRPVTVDAIAASIARWTRPAEAEEIRRALEEANSRH